MGAEIKVFAEMVIDEKRYALGFIASDDERANQRQLNALLLSMRRTEEALAHGEVVD